VAARLSQSTDVILETPTRSVKSHGGTFVVQFRRRNRRTGAAVTSAVRVPSVRRRPASYALRYQYVLPTGVYTGSTSVSSDQARDARPGDTVDVMHDPASPARHITTTLAQARHDLRLMQYISAGVLAILWCLALWCRPRLRRFD
jgi:hypothetical protein